MSDVRKCAKCDSYHFGSCDPAVPRAAGERERIGNEKENAVIQRARDEINRICVGRGGMTKGGMVGRQWTMSIPVRDDDDSDEIFAALVDLAVGLQVALSTAERERDEMRDTLRYFVDRFSIQGTADSERYDRALALLARVPSGGEEGR